MRMLSIRQPWLWAILHAGKRVENRTWSTPYRGPVALHAGKALTEQDRNDFIVFYAGLRDVPPLPDLQALPRGGILGVANIVGVRPHTDRVTLPDPWYFGPFGLLLQDVHIVPFMPLRGSLGLQYAPPEVVRHIKSGTA
jgi:hypothetical protein